MRTRLATLTLVPVLLVLAAGCGGSDGDSASSDASDTSKSAKQAPVEQSVAGTPDTTGSTTTGSNPAASPELQACMSAAGFAPDAPPTGGLVAWRHPKGARAVVGSSTDVTVGIASEIGTPEHPAQVDGTIVVAGPPDLAGAASQCLAGTAG
jgi:hypothetical protein